MIHKLLLLIPIFVFTYIHSHAQDKAKGLTTSDSLLTYMGRLMLSGKNLMFVGKEFMEEKSLFDFDNTGYFLGEKIWFKAYVTRAYDCKPTDISRVLYVELVNPSGEVIKKRNLKSTTTDRPTETSHLTVYTARTSMKYEPIHAI